MHLTDILKRVFGEGPVPVPTPSPPAPQPKHDPSSYAIPADCSMQATKVVAQFDTIARSYNIPIWAPQGKDDHQHDWGVILAHDDLQSVSLELLAADKTVLFEFKIEFARQKANVRFIDSASGIELPVLDRASVIGHRLIIQQSGRESVYRHFLRIGWSPAETLRKRQGDTFASEHARKITGGRQTANVHVYMSARKPGSCSLSRRRAMTVTRSAMSQPKAGKGFSCIENSPHLASSSKSANNSRPC